jgi:hypothetical protein
VPSVFVALVGGLTLVAAAIAVTLSGSPTVVIASNSIPATSTVDVTRGGVETCAEAEVLPAGTSAIRLWLTGNVKPAVRVEVRSGTGVVTRGSQGGGWTGKVVTVPVARVPDTVRDVTVCVAVAPAVEPVSMIGASVGNPAGSPSKMRIEYVRPSENSWWSLVPSVVRELGLGRALGGWWASVIPLLLMGLAGVVVTVTVARRLGRVRTVTLRADSPQIAPCTVDRAATASAEPARCRRQARRALSAALRRVPRMAWICALVACLSAASWSILTPPFQAVDEPSHFSYAQIVAETGSLPRSPSPEFSQEEEVALRDLDQVAVQFNPALGTISSQAQQLRLERDLTKPWPRVGRGAGVAGSQPPLYYALEAVPYKLGAGGTLLDQLALMRLLSALMAGVSALFGYLFLREALPSAPWAWSVGGLCMALAPLLGFISGAVTPDAMLCAVSAALFYCLARAFRCGLTPRLAVALGAIVAIGFLTKLNFIGLMPGVVLALLILARRAARERRCFAYRAPALALAIGVCPACAYVLINVLSAHAGLGLLSSGIESTRTHGGSPLGELSYIWQFYLPRLPGMANDFPGVSPLRELWFDRAVGMYGWLDTHFPAWVYNAALIPAGVIAALALRSLVSARAALRRRAAELLAYTAMVVGLMVLIGADSYIAFPTQAGSYSEPRYLLPLAVLFAAVLVLAARGAGRRWGPPVGTLMVVMFLAYDILSQLQLVGRYYT